jgi:Tfp pilus assembly protein PilF
MTMTLRQPALWTTVALALLAMPGPAAGQGDPRDPEELFAKAVALHQSGDTIGAIQYYEAVLELQPGRPDVLSNLGAAFVKLGRYDEAIEQYRAALEALPDDPEARRRFAPGVRLNLGLALYKANRIGDAEVEFRGVLEVEPRHPAANLLLADCLLGRGEFQEVVDLLSPLEADLGGDRLFIYQLGTALIETGEIERGQRLIDKLFSAGESAEGHVLMALQYFRQGNSLKALDEIENAVKLNPELPTVHALYARALRENRDHAGAAREYLEELKRNPNHFESNLWMGLLRREENRLDEAMEYLKRAARMRPGDPSVTYAMGRVHVAADRLPEAREAFEDLVEVAPGYKQGHVLLATVYYRLGERELGNEQRAIVEKLRAEEKEQQREEQDIGPTSFGPEDPSAGE